MPAGRPRDARSADGQGDGLNGAVDQVELPLVDTRGEPAPASGGPAPPNRHLGVIVIRADSDVCTPAMVAVTVTRTCPVLAAVRIPAQVTLAPAVLVSIGAIW